MNLHIARWGNSLALRIPARFASALGIKQRTSQIAEAEELGNAGFRIGEERQENGI